MNKKFLISLLTVGLIAGCQSTNEVETTADVKPGDYSKVKLAYGNVVKDGEVFIPSWVRNEQQINEVQFLESYLYTLKKKTVCQLQITYSQIFAFVSLYFLIVRK